MHIEDWIVWKNRGKYSVVSEFNIVCDEEWKAKLLQTGFFLGVLVGAGVFGYLSDKFGIKSYGGSLFLRISFLGLLDIRQSSNPPEAHT